MDNQTSVKQWLAFVWPSACLIQQILHSHTHLSVCHLGSVLSLWSVFRSHWLTKWPTCSDILLIAWVSVMAQKCTPQTAVYLFVWTLLWGLKHLAVSLWQANCWLIYVICASRQIDSRLTKEHFFTDDNQAIYLLLLIFLCIVCHNKLCSQLTSLGKVEKIQSADNI